MIPTVTPNNLISSFRNTLCYAHGTTLTCINQQSTTENAAGPLFQTDTGALVFDPYVVGALQVEGVGWRNPYGSVSYYDFRSGLSQTFPIITAKFQIATDAVYSAIVYQSLTSFLETNDSTIPFKGYGFTDFTRGRASNGWMCASNSSTLSCTFNQCIPSPTVICPPFTAYYATYTFNPFVNLLSFNVSSPKMPVLDMLSGLYVANTFFRGESYSQPILLGVPSCFIDTANAEPENPQSLSSCSVLVPVSQTNIPLLNSASTVSLGNWGGCAINGGAVVSQGGSLSCWTAVSYTQNPWEAYTSATYVQVNDTGACVQFIDSDFSQKVRCWGTPYTDSNATQQTSSILVNLNQTVSSPISYAGLTQPTFSCSISDIMFSNTCFACPYGYTLGFPLDSYPSCTLCSTSTPVRGISQTTCTSCGLGSQSTLDFSGCMECPLNSINSISGSLSCQECPPGFQAAADRQSCLACSTFIANSVREAGAAQCYVCYLPSYSTSPSLPCSICPAPQYPSITSMGAIQCTACPLGFEPNPGGSCTACVAPYVRSSVQDVCTQCLPGTQANSSYTACDPCTGNTFRSVALQCAECAPGTVPNMDHSACDTKVVKPNQFLTRGQTVYMSVGFAIVVLAFMSSSQLTPPQVILGVLLGLSIATGSYFLL